MFDEATRDENLDRDIVFVHIVRDCEHRVFESELREATERCSKARLVFIHTHPLDNEVVGVDFDLSGMVALGDIANNVELDLSKADWHFTGPVGFMEESGRACSLRKVLIPLYTLKSTARCKTRLRLGELPIPDIQKGSWSDI
jgi:ferredoxin-NADP reductase